MHEIYLLSKQINELLWNPQYGDVIGWSLLWHEFQNAATVISLTFPMNYFLIIKYEKPQYHKSKLSLFLFLRKIQDGL